LKIKKNERIILEKVEKDLIQSRVGQLTVVRSDLFSELERGAGQVAVSRREGGSTWDTCVMSQEAGSFLEGRDRNMVGLENRGEG